MKSKFSLAERMKLYEKDISIKLPIRNYIIMRLDGKAFHSFTRGMDKPFDLKFIYFMNEITKYICKEFQGVLFGYIQSDEINLVLYYKNLENKWFNNNIQKLCSISAGLSSAYAMKIKYDNPYLKTWKKDDSIVSFDSRVFIIPKEEVINYFIWRQQDWTRNSIQMMARSLYSHKQIENKNTNEMKDLIFIKNKNWNDLEIFLKRGRCCIKEIKEVNVDNKYFQGNVERFIWIIDNKIPIFTQNREYIEEKLK